MRSGSVEFFEGKHSGNPPQGEQKRRVVAALANSQAFFTVSMLMVVFNAVFVAIDVDHNNSDVITNALPQFIVAEYLFCAFFLSEMTIRFAAFERKAKCFTDGWFVFDSVLVALMIIESCVLPLAVAVFADSGWSPNFGGSLTVLRTLRLLRLTKIFRAVPQLLILVKGIAQALSSMLFAIVLLLVLLFVFGVIFASQAKGKNLYEFGSVTESSWSLLLYGTLLDSPAKVTKMLYDNDLPHLAWMFLLFIFLSSFTLLNMLIGIMCEVISRLSQNEKKEQESRHLRDTLLNILECYDKDDNRHIGRDEFDLFFKNLEVQDHLARFGTKTQGVVSLKPVLFDGRTEITFAEVLGIIMRLRGEHKAAVTDIIELREFIRQCHADTKEQLIKGQEELKARRQLPVGVQEQFVAGQEELEARRELSVVQAWPWAAEGTQPQRRECESAHQQQPVESPWSLPSQPMIESELP